MYAVDWRIDAEGNLVVERQTDERPRDLAAALEALTTNGFDWIRPEEIEALTDVPIIGRDVTRDDAGKLETVGTVWWYPQYETTDPVGELMEYGLVVFTRAPNDIP